MTTADTFASAASAPAPGRFRLPDIPERHPDEMSQFDHLFKHGNSHHLAIHLGNPETTLVEADRWIIIEPGSFRELARYPDLLVAFDVDPAAYAASNGYIVSEQGKPPDFVLEVASASTAEVDLNEKRRDYAIIGVREYWRFDKTGEHYGARLYGESLTDDGYEAIPIAELASGRLQGYSEALNVCLRCEDEELVFYDPTTDQPIMTYETWRARATIAEARVRELEERLRRQGS